MQNNEKKLTGAARDGEAGAAGDGEAGAAGAAASRGRPGMG